MKYKNIKSIAHNLGHSFLSDMNASGSGGRYVIVPELLFAAAARERIPQVRIDLISRQVTPTSVISKELQGSVVNYAAMLFRLCHDQNVDDQAIRSAELMITFDYDRVRRTKYHPIREIQEFACVVEIVDDRGVLHQAHPDHWWMV
ncbi:MAG TPA: hypothetical protein VNO75_13710 [Gemmatimonadaceae bacterium]|nr:hypothetical protein [Gemmatimonadaceae bacterium]